ncbi:HK97 family phage prohead protease, partial [Mediterraneibacter glycyrrhizinilyticus]|uniref:HK97 family phage prohead protease n=1 Tax=Mediterraneibacter glycyrrhizinilyticus TaxID=342942 RepID=UPI00196147E1
LASFSIGFLGLEAESIYKEQDGRQYFVGRKFTKIELMEVSQVLIPSNRGALQASAELMEMA